MFRVPFFANRRQGPELQFFSSLATGFPSLLLKKHEFTEKGKKAQSQQQEIIKKENKGSN